MAVQANAHLVSSFRSLSKISGSIVVLIGGLGLAGWILNVPSLKSIFPNTPQMVPNTALAFILTGASLRMLLDIESSSWIRKWYIPQLGAMVVGLMGILTLTEHISGLNLGIDSILLPETGVPEAAYPGRMSPHTAFTFILVSMSLLLIDVKGRSLQAQSLALGGGLIALLALTGYAYGVPFLYSVFNRQGMALHTAVSFMLLCIGVLFVRPDQGFMTLLASESTGGFVARRFLPIAVAVPLALGWLRLKGEQAGFYSTEVGLLLFAISNIVILTSVIWWYSRSLDKTELADDLAYGILALRGRTTHTLTEQTLQKSEDRFRQVVENIRKVLWMKDVRHNQMIYVNPAYGEIWGRSCESLYVSPDSWLDAVHPIDRERIMEAALSKQVQGTYGEVYRIMRPDGTLRWIAEQTFPVKDESGDVCRIVGIAEDITERKMLEDQLHHAQKMEIIGRLAGGVAHDFNNILTAIIGYATLLQMKMQEDDPLKLNVEPILAASEKAAALTRSLLAFSRKQALNPEPVNLNDIIRRLERLLLKLIGEETKLHIELADEDLVVMADSMQIDQVLMNLASNARDAMPNEGLLTITTGTIELDDKFIAVHGYGTPGMYALLSVTDTGTGMDEKTRERIFEPFFTTKDVGKGTGLGLAIVYGIVKQHEGYINVYSEPGEGTTFKIYLPLIKERQGD